MDNINDQPVGDLGEFLKSDEYKEMCNKRYKFRPSCSKNPISGDLTAMLKNRPYYAQWIDHNLTVYRDMNTKEIVGYIIANPEELVKEYKNDETRDTTKFGIPIIKKEDWELEEANGE